MLPSRIRIAYTVPDQSCAYAVSVDAASGFDCGPLTPLNVAISQVDDVLRLRLRCEAQLQLLSCVMVFDHQFSPTEKVLFNGWQSWTDTHEVPADATLPGLSYTPQPVIDRWIVDASGDYRFTTYENRPGVRHGWTYAYFTARDGEDDSSCLLMASLDESQGFTKISMDKATQAIAVEPETPLTTLEAGEQWGFDLAILDRATVDEAFDRWFALNGVTARKALLLTGYSSWYRHYDDITAEVLAADLTAYQQVFAQLNTEGFQPLFQVDDGYCLVGDWQALDQEKFPDGLAALAQEIREAGFLPGIWMAPFVCEEDSQLFAQHQDWLLRDDQGKLVRAGSHWSGSYALDTLNSQVRDYVRQCVSDMVAQGFGLLKLDFLYASCMVPHGGMNRGQLMFDAAQLLREAAGDALIVGCGVPLAAAFGRFEYCRVGCDVSSQWDGPVVQRVIDRERVSAKNSLGNTVYRAPLHGRAFSNDPDAVYVSPAKMTEEHRMLLLTGAACFGGTLLSSDDASTWDDAQRAQFQEALDLMRQANAARGAN